MSRRQWCQASEPKSQPVEFLSSHQYEWIPARALDRRRGKRVRLRERRAGAADDSLYWPVYGHPVREAIADGVTLRCVRSFPHGVNAMEKADPIPTVREDQAEGAVAAIFEDLRTTLRIPIVNLIWRHLATMPAILAWSWAMVKPLHGSGLVAAHGQALRASVRRPTGITQPDCVFDALGVDRSARATIVALLDGYGTGNAANLLSLSTVQRLLEGGVAGGAAPEAVAETPLAIPAPMPRLLGLDELTPPLLALVQALDRFGRRGEGTVIASLYRHLGYWPEYLSVAHAALSPAQADGWLRREHEQVLAAAQTIVTEALLPIAPTGPVPAGEEAEAARRMIARFTDDMIGRMIVMGETMRGVLP